MSSGCNEIVPNEEAVPARLEFAVRISYEQTTKAIKNAFASGDVVYAFFNNVAVNATPKYATLTYNGSKWTGALQGGLDISELAASGATMSVVYFPFGTVNITSSGDKYVFTGADDQPIYTYYLCATAPYELTSAGEIATLTATLNMAIPADYVQFFVDKSGSDYASDGKYRLVAKDVRPAACSSYTPAGGFVTKTLDYSQPMWGYAYNDEGILFSGQINASTWSSATARRFIFFETGKPAKSSTISKTLVSHAAVKLMDVASWPAAITVPGAVDMGLYKNNDPNTGKLLLWADRNLGAQAASTSTNYADYGFLFAWGEIVPFFETDGWQANWQMKSSTSQDNYYWNNAGINSKYSTDGISVLDAQDDAATAYLGDGWRMPTKEELYALLQLGVDYDSYNVRLIGGKIYFPNAGRLNGYPPQGRGSQGYNNYWSSTILSSTNAWYNYGGGLENNGSQYIAMAVRPVKEVQAISNLIHYWPFNGNLNDAVTEGAINASFIVNSETHEATLTEDRHGNANSAYSFDGYNIISIGHAGDFGTSSFTANMWICTTATTYFNTLIRTEGSSGGNGWFIRFKDSDIEIWASGNQYVSNTKINDGIWHMITFVHDTNNKVGQLYVDGVYKGGYTMSSVPNVSSDGVYTHVLGSGTHYRHCVYDGKMDEVRLYNKALTAAEVEALYQY